MADEDDDYVPLTETPEWKRAKANRGAPHGRHIKPARAGAAEAGEYSREELFEALAALERKKMEDGMVISGVKFDRSISLGAVAGIAMTLLSWGGAYGIFTRWQGDIENKIAANTAAITENRKGDEDRSHKYVPQIEAMQRVTDMTNSRFETLTSSLNQLRDTVGKLADTVSQTHEEIMVLRARLGYDKRTELIQPPLSPRGP